MSRLFYSKFINVINKLDFNKLSVKDKEKLNNFVCFGLGFSTLFHMYYTYGTLENKVIKVEKKYKFTRNGFTEFMIIDSKGVHYNVNNSFWLWKWDSIEDWNSIETNKPIVVTYYGIRIPLFGIFPNIINSNQKKMLKSITSSECRVLDAKYNTNTIVYKEHN